MKDTGHRHPVASKLDLEEAPLFPVRNVFRVYRDEFVGIAKSRKRRARQVLKARSLRRVATHTYIRGKCTNRSVSHREYVIPRHARAYQFLPLHEIPPKNRGARGISALSSMPASASASAKLSGSRNNRTRVSHIDRDFPLTLPSPTPNRFDPDVSKRHAVIIFAGQTSFFLLNIKSLLFQHA